MLRCVQLAGLILVLSTLCHGEKCVAGPHFQCSRGNIRKCRGTDGFRAIKEHCNAVKKHYNMIEELSDIFESKDQKRYRRRLEETEFETPSSFKAAASCNIGGGTINTFDGYSHVITGGPCTYVLAVDRSIEKMVVYGIYDSLHGGSYANRLKNVALFLGKTSLVLGESFDINYQGLGYGAPAIVDDKLLVWRDDHFIYAEEKNGQVRIRWDPAGQLQISIGGSYGNQTMGLCGLYNDDASVGAEHNSIEFANGNAEMSSAEFSTEWALSGCYHEPKIKLEERFRNCDKMTFNRLCSVTHAAPDLADCLREDSYGRRYQQECLKNLCICDDLDSCMYSETLRIANDCYDRLGLKIKNEDLRAYLDTDYIQRYLPDDHREVPTETEDKGEESGAPASYEAFIPAADCYVYGHSYMQTFDEVSYRTGAHGCTYPLAVKAGVKDFAVYGTFGVEGEEGAIAASLSYVSLFDLRNRVRVQLGQGREINYEGRAVLLPYHREFVSIWEEGDHVFVFDHDLGLELRWDGRATLRIRVSKDYHGSTRGLCGTFNGESEDEINLLHHRPYLPQTYQEMVQDWQLPSCSFNPALYNSEDQCIPSMDDYMKCRLALTSVKFSFCVTDLPPIHFIERCEQDLCRCLDDEQCKCDIVSAYAQMCEDRIRTPLAWRSEDLCPADACYFANNGCQHTCTAPGICSCDPGFELGSDGKSCLVNIAV